MKTLDFSKYAGTYSLKEAEGILNSMKLDVFKAKEEEELERMKVIHGDKFIYELREGTSIDLRNLKDNMRICASNIKGHHILMIEK
jgi:hypothetical protein